MIDPYAPWREPVDVLESRHVGRADELAAIRKTARAFLDGARPTDIYLYGPRGTGKSHLLALVRPDLEAWAKEAGTRVFWLAEDIPLLPTADALLARVSADAQGSAWARWGAEAGSGVALDGAILLLEGLDRQLKHWKEVERRRLRQRFAELGVCVIASGVSLGAALRGREAALAGHFSPWPLGPLDGEEPAVLLDAAVPEEIRAASWWPGRRDALVALAGGSPRTLVALAESCAERADDLAADHLYRVLKEFTANYQMRFRDLSAQQQRVVELLAQAPRRVSPTEVSKMLGLSQPAASTALATLGDLGLVLRQQDGRRAWFWLAEDLFRHWLEYRTGEWASTRVAFLARVLEALLGEEELVSLWGAPVDPEMEESLRLAVIANDGVKQSAVDLQIGRVLGACLDGDGGADAAFGAVARLATISKVSSAILSVCLDRFSPNSTQARHLLDASVVARSGPLRAVLALVCRVESEGGLTLDALSEFAREADSRGRNRGGDGAAAVLARMIEQLDPSAPASQGWVLGAAAREQLARIPEVRALLLSRGPGSSGAPLLREEDVLPACVAPIGDAAALLLAAHRTGLTRLQPVVAPHLRHFYSHIEPNPRPETAIEVAADWFATTIEESSRVFDAARFYSIFLSWASTWGLASADAFASVLDALAENTPLAHAVDDTWPSAAAETALLTLALDRPDRFGVLRARLGGEASPLEPSFRRIEGAVAQLAEAGTAPLQPELARVLELIRPPG